MHEHFLYLSMKTLKYKVISNKTQYRAYTNALDALIFSGSKDRNTKDEMALLTVLIEKWDAAHNTFQGLDPVQLIQALMDDHQLKSKDLADMLDIGKSYVSDILNYKKGLSKDIIRKLSAHFKISQEAFNQPYELVAPRPSVLHKVRVNKGGKKLVAV
jgi:HTH-type transcriptional regulator / antitoxin HigA